MSNLRQRKHVDISGKSEEPPEEDVKPDARWGLFFKLFAFVFFILPSVCILAFVFLVESPIDPEPVTDSLPEPPQLEGPLASNDLLVFQGERLFEGKLIAPETIAHQSGHLYTGTADGKIVHMDLKTQIIETIATLGPPPCGEIIDEEFCGRPLGMRFNNDGYLVVVDAYLGMYKINVASRDVFQLFPGRIMVDGLKLSVLNDLDIATDGTVYFTESTRFSMKEFILELLEGKPRGRLLKYDPIRNKTEVVKKNLYFPNGVQLSKDNSYLLVAETSKARILKYHITGSKQGELEIFADNLPGLPDNIRRSSSGGYWVALAACRNAGQLNLLDILQHYPWLRKQIAKIPVKFLTSATTIRACSLIVELDKQGNIIRNLRDPDGERFLHISHVEEDAGYLYLGSYSVPYVGKVNTYKKPLSV